MLTQDEAELYDRQIRLWGVNAQSRIRQSKVLMLGFNGVASEVAKILVLAGIDTLTIVDDQPLRESDLTSNLFCRPSIDALEQPKFRTHQVEAKLKILNPLVKVNIDNSPILSKESHDFEGYDLVTLHSFLTIDETSAINDICRLRKIKFYIVLDYGFFGFMFNDLGPEFKFTYEEFNHLDSDSRQSGEEKDPISLGDDPLEDPDDVGYGTSDDEEDRPKKKKRRLHSPARGASSKIENEKQTKVGTLSYSAFKPMISTESLNLTKQTSPILLVSIAMYKFYSQFGHLPRATSDQEREDDTSKLVEIIERLRDSYNIPESVFKKLAQEWTDNTYGSLSPVCAITGGVAGQDMIRALSNKDIPLNNTFSFDGISMNGVVERVGIDDSKASIVKPIVRDFLQIDDDD